MIIPQRNIEEIRIFKCPICGDLFRNNPQMTNVSCLVNHPPGSCCHYSDIPITANLLKSMMALLEEVKE